MTFSSQQRNDTFDEQVSSFDVRSGSAIERALFNHRQVVIFVCLVITLLLGWQVSALRLNASFEKMIPTGHPYVANFLANRSELSGAGNLVRIAVQSTNGSVIDAGYLETRFVPGRGRFVAVSPAGRARLVSSNRA